MAHSKLHNTFEVVDAAWVPTGSHYYRILTDSMVIKYLSFDAPNLIFPDIHGNKLGFTTLPEGDWNVGYLNQMTSSNKFMIGTTEIRALQSVEKIWHSSMIDYMALGESESGEKELQCQNQMHSVVYRNHFGIERVIVNHDWNLDDIYGPVHETEIYSLIQAYEIGPRFLAHVTENRDRVIGYMVEAVPGRHAATGDLSACREVLSKLHSLGIAHGHLKPNSFLITNGRALLHGFGGSYITDDQSVLDAEMASLENVLQQEWRFPTFIEGLVDENAATG